ncbi:endonuclease/exonuclease/phosphatase family protein [Amnibacterium kyonggiense]|uniref:Endonuclease/exonuclease/phosphatase (EEP) superfamily protein YafD n=1 Tax=Amnibacterium kyonggiense TaxID=595671 RepID=A0A4R7FGA3_9MICO|nr:endonuclease/exonuclease/phosphatase family protein [Amnibacterium kyonggiense]TDS75970.1 endonuclease/exonuclease/phosphatase (EEP) superfamily protein YafD [Amnibacterium kyonggiense]
MFRRFVAIVAFVALAAALTLVAWPQLLGLQRAPVLALAVSFRGAAAAAALAVAVVLTAVGLVLHRLRRGLGVLALLLVAFAAAEAGVLVVRGVGAPDVPVAQADDVTVLSWNTLGDSVPAQVVARAAAENRATVVALPETTEGRARQVADLLARQGSTYTVFSRSQQAGIPARSTSVLVSTALGRYREVTADGDTVGVPSVVLDPAGGQNAPRIVAVHTTAPYDLDPATWRSDLRWVAARCSERNVLIAGDFNATIDHLDGLGPAPGRLRTCRDAALATGNAAVGTWPTSMPALIGTPIDHVLATPNWRFTGFRVLSDDDAAGSDHRPVLARLRPAG